MFDLPWQADWRLVGVGGGLGVLAAVGAGMFATRRVLDAPPSVTLWELREAALAHRHRPRRNQD